MLRLEEAGSEPHWEDGLTREQVEAIVEAGVLSEEEWDTVLMNGKVYSEEDPWRLLLLQKAVAIADALKTLGVDLQLHSVQGKSSYPVGMTAEPEAPAQHHGAH